MTLPLKRIVKHSLVWAAFVTYELSYVYLNGIPLSKPWDYFFHYVVNIFLFYANTVGLTFIFGSKVNKALATVLFIAAEIGVYLGIQYLVFLFLSLIYDYKPPTSTQLNLHHIKEVYRAIYFIGLSVAYWLGTRLNNQAKVILELENNRLRQENQNAELGKNLMHAKNAYLQSQLNPHLLFNTLSFIYNSVRKISAKASAAILLLSEMMRYSLSEADSNGKVYLQNETEHITNLVKLNQLRFNERLNFELEIGDISADAMIIPLLLLSFIENIFKHGDLSDPLFPARVIISCKDELLTMMCVNKRSATTELPGWGIGLDNARSRLDVHYPNNYRLEIQEEHLLYQVSLSLHLK